MGLLMAFKKSEVKSSAVECRGYFSMGSIYKECCRDKGKINESET